MEDILAYALVVFLVIAIVYGIRKSIKLAQARMEQQAARLLEHEKMIEQYRKTHNPTVQRYADSMKTTKRPAMKKANVSHTDRTPTPSSSGAGTLDISDVLLTGLALNSIMHSNDSTAKESSWGLDDSSSRSSISDSMSSSYDSSSSSYDSGPSSDW